MEVASIDIAAEDASSDSEGADAVIDFDFFALGFLGLSAFSFPVPSWLLGCLFFFAAVDFPSFPAAFFPLLAFCVVFCFLDLVTLDPELSATGRVPLSVTTISPSLSQASTGADTCMAVEVAGVLVEVLTSTADI